MEKLVACSLAALVSSLLLVSGADAQYRDRQRDYQGMPDESRQQMDRDRRQRRDADDERRDGRDGRTPRSQAQPGDERPRMAPDHERPRTAQPQRQRAEPDRGQPQRQRAEPDRGQPRMAQPQRERVQRDRARPRVAAPQRRAYERHREREWHRERKAPPRQIYVPRRWTHYDAPHHRHLRDRHYGQVWWCGTGCRIALLFGFTIWTIDTVLSDQSTYSFPAWEALEYNRTGETSLWESSWGYVEFTPTRTYTMRFGRYIRDCRDFLRVVVRNDGLERRYRGTACRNPYGDWWIVS